MAKIWFYSFILICFCGCGSNDNSAVSDNQNTYLMGGAIQGKELTLNGFVLSFAGAPFGASGSDDGHGSTAKLNVPYDITTDGNNLYVADTFNSTIRKIVISTGDVTTIAGKVGITGSTNGIGTEATFDTPRGITTDGRNIYVTEPCIIRKISIATGAVTTLAGTYNSPGSVDGFGSNARFGWYLGGITTDGINLYVADSGDATIRKISISTGEVTTFAGTSGIWQETIDGIGSAARFQGPEGITTDGKYLYIADINNTIRKIFIASREVTTIAGTPTQHLDGSGGVVGFKRITTDGTNIYVTSTYTQTIQKMVLSTGIMATIAGTTGTAGLNNKTALEAKFNYPIGIVTNGKSLFIVDSRNNTIRNML